MYHCVYDLNNHIAQEENHFEPISSSKSDQFKCTDTYNKVQDFSKALKWYNYFDKSYKNFDMGSLKKTRIYLHVNLGLGLLYKYDDAMEQYYQKASGYYKRYSDHNGTVRSVRVGLLYYYGKGVQIDYKKTFELFEEVPIYTIFEDRTIFLYDQNNLDASDSKKKLTYYTKTRWNTYKESYYYMELIYKHRQDILKDEGIYQDRFKKALMESPSFSRSGCFSSSLNKLIQGSKYFV